MGFHGAGALRMPLDHAEAVALGLSLKVSLVGVLCSLPVAVACAWLLARTRFIGKPLFEAWSHDLRLSRRQNRSVAKRSTKPARQRHL